MRRTILQRFSSLLGAHVWREILQAVFLLVLARRNPTGYGEIMLAFQFGAILLLLSEAGMNPYLVVHLSHDPARRDRWLRRFAGARLALLLAGCTGAWLFARLQGYPPRLQALVLILGGAIGFDALANAYYTGLQVAGRQTAEGRIRGWAATLGWGFALAALAAGWNVFRLSIGKWLESIAGLAGAIRANPRPDETPDAESGESAGPRLTWRDALPFVWLALAAILYNKANVFFLQRWAGSAAVAQYSATWQLVDGLPILASNLLLGRVLYPLFVRQWRANRPGLERLVQDTVRWLSLAALVAGAALALAAAPVIRLLYGPAYAEAARLQPLLAWCIPFALLHNVAAYLLLAAGRRRFLVAAYGAALALNLLLCRFWIPSAPLDGAAWAIVLTKGALAAATITAASRLIPFWSRSTLAGLLGVALAGGALHWIAAPLLGTAALLPAALPAAALAARWWKTQNRDR